MLLADQSFLAALVFCWLSMLCAPTALGQPIDDPSLPVFYQVGTGDILKVDVYGEPDLGREVQVSASESIDLPLLGEVQISHLTAEQVARRLEELWGADFLVDPHVSVRIQSYGSRQVQVLGAVHKPGQIYLTRPTLLLDILAQAGGIITEKSAKEVHVKRDGTPDGKSIVVKLERLVTDGEGNIAIQAGDVIYVPEGLYVYVMGEVQKSGPVLYFDGLTITGAITAVGGPTTTARLRSAYILRGEQRVRVNIKRILKGKEPDAAMEPGDRLYLDEAVF